MNETSFVPNEEVLLMIGTAYGQLKAGELDTSSSQFYDDVRRVYAPVLKLHLEDSPMARTILTRFIQETGIDA